MAVGKSDRQPFCAVDERKIEEEEKCVGKQRGEGVGETGKRQINLLVVFWIDRSYFTLKHFSKTRTCSFTKEM